MKRIILTMLIIVLPYGVYGQDLNLNKFQSSTFDGLAKITGQTMGAGIFHNAGTHDVGGFDAGAKIMVSIVPSGEKTGSLNDTRIVHLPVLQGNIGLPGDFEIGARYFKYNFGTDSKEEVSFTSGVLKYNILDGLTFPSISVFTSFSRLSGINDFSMNNFSFGAIIGKGLPIVNVYGGAYFNYSVMNIEISPTPGLYPTGYSDKIKVKSGVLVGGLAVNLAPFTRLNAEYVLGEIQTFTLGLVFSLF